jgi:hypothetical protein
LDLPAHPENVFHCHTNTVTLTPLSSSFIGRHS